MKLSTRCRLPPNHRRFFMSLSMLSTLVMVTLVLVLHLSSSARIFSTAVDESYHLRVHASVMLSGPTSILACIFSNQFGCRPYLSRSTSCKHRWCNLWSAVTLMIFGSHFFAASRSSSWCSITSIFLVPATPICSLRLPFSLYVSL